MPRQILDGASLPLTIAAPGTNRRWFVLGFLIQGTGDGTVTLSGGNGAGAANETIATVRVAASGGGAIAEHQSAEIGTALLNAELIVSTTGTPGTVTGYIDYCWR